MKIGSIFDQTSTTEFVSMLSQQFDSERLLFSYVELSPDGGEPKPDAERIVARITSLHKENPLLSRDQAGVSAAIDLGGLGFEFSRRFTYGWAQCSVIGTLSSGRLDMNRRVPPPNAEVHTPSVETLQQLFFNPAPWCVPLGAIETFGEQDISEVPVTLNADQLSTKHFCIFGMTGSGKTNTAAKLIEEFMARGHRMIIFDSHDDYLNLEDYANLFRDTDLNGNAIEIGAPIEHGESVREVFNLSAPTATIGKPIAECVYERLIRSASVIYANTPARSFLRQSAVNINASFVRTLLNEPQWNGLLTQSQVTHYRSFPELKFYGPGFEDFSILLIQAFRNEDFTPAQWRWLRQVINQNGSGLAYLQALRTAIQTARATAPQAQQITLDVLRQSIFNVRAIYSDAVNAGSVPLDLEVFFGSVAARATALPGCVFRLSMSDLPSSLRKAMVYAVVTYFFRSYKFRGYRATPRAGQQANAFPVLFVLEEARALIPKSSGPDDADVSGMLARRSMRELAYEGRKFSLGFGLISQKPSTIDQEVVSQSNTFILHQLKSPDDQAYVRSVTESMGEEELGMIKSLGTGRAIIAGVSVNSPVLLRVFLRYSAEGIEEPRPIRDELGGVKLLRQQLGIIN
jgi:uncharacterized protein